MLDPTVFLVIFAAGAVFIITGKYYSTASMIRRRLKRAPLRTTAAFPENTVGTVQGTLRYLEDAPLVAPLSGRPCAYYEVVVEESKGKGEVREIIRKSEGRDFLLEDAHGRARVHMHGYEVLVVEDVHHRSGLFQKATPELERFLARHREQSTNLLNLNRALRYREGILEAGETVAVCGTATREADPDPRAASGGYRESASRLVLSASARMPLYVSDSLSALR